MKSEGGVLSDALLVNEEEEVVDQGTAVIEDGDEECGPSFFEEESTCRDILARVATMLPADRTTLLPTIGQDPNGAAALLEVKFAAILERYQENSYLLHPYLESLMQPLVSLLCQYLPPADTRWMPQATETQTTTAATSETAQAGETARVESTGLVVQANELGQNFDMFDADAPKNALHLVCRAIYLLVKTAREKACTSYFPNDTKHYEDVFYALRHWKLDAACQREWEVRYCLLLWLSNLVLVPFNLNLIDTHLVDDSTAATTAQGCSPSCESPTSFLSDALLIMAAGFLADTSKCREGAALLSARLLTRPDSRRHRDHFFHFVARVLSASSSAEENQTGPTRPSSTLADVLEATTATAHRTFLLPGVLLAVAKTMKLGKREELAVYATPEILTCVIDLLRTRTSDALLCKTAVKVVQRLALSMLRKTTANWRYQRHVTALGANLDTATTVARDGACGPATAAPTANEDETEAVIEGDEGALEDGIGALLEAIGHKDTIVRWSAAKGIGRVCARLPVAMAEEVIDALMGDAFSSAYNDSQWHGGLLALAELCRRSMISAEQLPSVVATVARGLTFDLSKGTYSVGAHVRDAACYTCWSIARAYDAADLEAHVRRLSASLVVTALFDREVNVRRAAAAAFQECVGRLGNFPDGIDLVTTMDFFSLASLKNAYEVVAPRVAVYSAYRASMLAVLLDTKICHWDRRVRHAAATALGAISPLCADAEVSGDTAFDAFKAQVLPVLLARVTDEAVAARHGAVLGLAALVTSLPVTVWREEERQQLAEVLTRVDGARLFRSRGGEFIRDAMCALLRAFAVVRLPLPETVTVTKVSGATAKAKTLGRCQEFLEDTWKNLLEWLQLTAADTFRHFAAAYYTTFQTPFHGKMMAKMLAGCAPETSPMERRGFLAAMGGLPLPLLVATVPPDTTAAANENGAAPTTEDGPVIYAERVKTVLCAACLVPPSEDPERADAEGRRNAVKSLGEVVVRVPLHFDAVDGRSGHQHKVSLSTVVDTLLSALQDYAVDKRGDVGSFVRVAVLQALPGVLLHGLASPQCYHHENALTTDTAVRALQSIVKAAMEKLDRVRRAAGLALCELLVDRGDDLFATCFTADRANAATVTACLRLRRFVTAHATSLDWASPSQVFPRLVPLLLVAPCACVFGLSAMEGLVVSAGDVSSHVQEPAQHALLDVARAKDIVQSSHEEKNGVDATAAETPDARQGRLSSYLVAVAAKYVHCERVLVPLSRVADVCMNQGVLDARYHSDVVDVLRNELKHYALNITVLLPLVGLLTSLCRSPSTAARMSAWALTLTMIASRYPKVRQKVATEFYTSLLVLASSSPSDTSVTEAAIACPSAEDYQRAMSQLLSTQWDGTDAIAIRKARDDLYGMLHMTPPSSLKNTNSEGHDVGMGLPNKKAERGAVASSYAALVREAGY